MNSQQQEIIDKFDALLEGITKLKDYLSNNDDDGAHEAITVTMMMGLQLFGTESGVMQHLFPVFDNIKRQIDAMQIPDALRQAELCEKQLREIQTLIANG